LTTSITQPNIINMAMTPAMYADCPSTGVWDVQLTFSDGRVTTPLAGKVTITPDVTDSLPLGTRTVVRQNQLTIPRIAS
jgi:hypothetical protein